MENDPSEIKGDNLPVQAVSWEDCREFCEKTALCLPTEAQWEFACRAGTKTAFSFGETIKKKQAAYGADDLFDPIGSTGITTAPVDSFNPNAFGLHNMHGNVFEWCQDVYDERFYEKPEAKARNPVSTSGSNLRVFRGGGYKGHGDQCRSAWRGGNGPRGGFWFIGLRPAYYPLP